MKNLLCLAILVGLSLSVIGRERYDFYVSQSERETYTWNGCTVTFAIKPELTYLFVRFYGPEKKIKKVSGFSYDDTNRTLVYSSGKVSLYYVDEVACPVGKVKMAFISE